MLAVPTWDENDKIKKVASVVSKLKIIALGVVVLKYLSNVANCSLLIIVWIDVAAPKPNSNGSAIIFAKFKLRPNRIVNDNVKTNADTKFRKTIKTFL